ncbi:hypothetical protein B0G84_8915 [Paraburkholderia sp. BL8N3]|nr:hypothetical protein [Paraburkholderia sp. BL8N3]TCK31834.1 hypothetical protein B0G84_8915 [Paraburkholderia sp. BL8N3]
MVELEVFLFRAENFLILRLTEQEFLVENLVCGLGHGMLLIFNSMACRPPISPVISAVAGA